MPVRVLLVEDSHHLRAAMKEMLKELGNFELVAEIETEAEGKFWVTEHPGTWDLAVIDLVLAQGTGMGVIAACRKAAPDARIVVFSDYATPGIRRHCLHLGADIVFQKNEEVPAFADYCEALAAGEAPPRSPVPTAPPM